jgi:hypothetical protein
MKVNCAMAVLGCLGAALFGAPAAAQQFSAELVDTGSGNAGHATEVHVSDGKLRIETPGKHRGFMLTDSKAGTSYIVMPEQRMYMDMAAMGGSRMIQVLMPADPNNACPEWQEATKSAEHGADALTSCRRIGGDTVNGRSAVKYEGTTRKGEHAFAWVDPKLRFMLKTETSSGERMELRNIHEGPQPASLFAIPADFHKVDMKGMMQRFGKPQG